MAPMTNGFVKNIFSRAPGRGGGAVDGSLDLVAGAIAKVGLRGIVCYEVTDRNGLAEAAAGVRENDRFLERVGELADAQLIFSREQQKTAQSRRIGQSGEEVIDGNHGYKYMPKHIYVQAYV